MRSPLLECSAAVLAQYLLSRVGALCTMCGASMTHGYCANEHCKTYPATLGAVFITRFIAAIEGTHRRFKKRVPLKPIHSKTVSGGRVESKRRKH